MNEETISVSLYYIFILFGIWLIYYAIIKIKKINKKIFIKKFKENSIVESKSHNLEDINKIEIYIKKLELLNESNKQKIKTLESLLKLNTYVLQEIPTYMQNLKPGNHCKYFINKCISVYICPANCKRYIFFTYMNNKDIDE